MRAAALVVLLSACGTDEVDLTGVYRVDADVGASPCGNDQPLAMPPPFLKLVKEEFIGTEYFSMETCSDQAATNCSGGGLFGDSFGEPIDGGWRGVVTASSGDTTMCVLTYKNLTAKLTGTMLVVDSETHGEETMGTACSPEEAERRNTKMPCLDHERIDATRL